jgi:hypothetical protein
MPSLWGLARETAGNAFDDIRTGFQSSRQRSWLWPRDGDTRQKPGPSRGRIKETYAAGQWWRYHDGRTPAHEPEAVTGHARPGPPDALVRRLQRQASARQARTRGRSVR